MNRFLLLVPLLLVSGALAACGGSDSRPVSVDVFLTEWEISPEAESAPAGDLRFTITNGGNLVHQLVIIRTGMTTGELPTKDDGTVDEAAVDVAGRVDNVAPGGIERGTFKLEAGRYVLACNIVDESSSATLSHYQKGMHAAFTVEGEE